MPIALGLNSANGLKQQKPGYMHFLYPRPMCQNTQRPRIVDDLVPIILEAHDHWWPRDFQQLALISSQWVGPVRRRLYAHPRLSSFRSCDLLARSLKDNPHLVPLIHSIDLRPWCGHHNRVFTEKEIANVKFILAMPDLSSVTLGGQLAIAAEGFLQSIGKPQSLTELHIDGYMPNWAHDYLPYLTTPPSLRWDESIALRFPKLRKLRLSNIELTIDEPNTNPCLRLTDLALNGVIIARGSLHHLCHGSWDTLAHLSIIADIADDFDEHIRSILHKSTDNLEAFSYEVPDSRTENTIFHGELAPLLSLRELHLRGVSIGSLTLESIQQRCQRLEHLSILGRIINVTYNEWAVFIRSGALPFLRELSMPHGNGPPYADWSEATVRQLMEACVDRGIRVSCPFFYGHRL